MQSGPHMRQPPDERPPQSNQGRSSAAMIAIAGIAATALVGIVGSVTTWVVARDNPATQVALARDERIYDRRSMAYIDALTAMQALSDDLRLLRFESVPTWRDFQRKQANLRARMTALASSNALGLYNTMYLSGSRTLSAVQQLRETPDYRRRGHCTGFTRFLRGLCLPNGEQQRLVTDQEGGTAWNAFLGIRGSGTPRSRDLW